MDNSVVALAGLLLNTPGPGPERALAIDVGAGTQDVLLYERDRPVENCVKLVLPSRTCIIGQSVRAVTREGRPLHLSGTLMGGGASTETIRDHLAAGLPVSATVSAARTLHNDPARVVAMGVALQEDPPPDAVTVNLGDLDLPALRGALAPFGIDVPDRVAVAVQDHGFAPGIGNNELRFAYLQRLIDGGGDLASMVFRTAPPGMTRMAAIQEIVPGSVVMDTGAAAILGMFGDPDVAGAIAGDGAILVNVGNMHTFATLVRGRRLFGLFEHHTGGLTAAKIGELVDRLRRGQLSGSSFREEFDGHGAALASDYRTAGSFDFVAVTGPNRAIARSLGYHEAVPYGDMMLAGSFGLVVGLRLLAGA